MKSKLLGKLLRSAGSQEPVVIALAQAAAFDKRQAQRRFRRALRVLAEKLGRLDQPARDRVLREVVPASSLDDYTESLIKRVGGGVVQASFRASLTRRSKMKALNGRYAPEWMLNDKLYSLSFIDSLGVRRPIVHASGSPLRDLPKKSGVVVKPVDAASARGVFVVIDEHEIVDVRRARRLASWDELVDAGERLLRSGRLRQDRWIMEERIFEERGPGESGRDLKFYCFYGKVGLVLEVRRFPEVQYCWWDASGERIETGKYDDRLHEGRGFSPEDRALAEQISLEIPAPFIRIDFLSSSRGLVFGEFTPRPGAYDRFNDHTDCQLGDYFWDAEGRLVRDLLGGKRFDNFAAYEKSLHR